MLEARLNVVTLGVHNLPLVRSFYEALGWASHTDGDEFARFDTGGATLALFLADKLAAEAHSTDVPEPGYRGVTLGIVVESAEAVDVALRLVEQAGGRLLGEPVEREWGGRSGYFADPEGNAWEVAWLPGGRIAESGVLVWP